MIISFFCLYDTLHLYHSYSNCVVQWLKSSSDSGKLSVCIHANIHIYYWWRFILRISRGWNCCITKYAMTKLHCIKDKNNVPKTISSQLVPWLLVKLILFSEYLPAFLQTWSAFLLCSQGPNYMIFGAFSPPKNVYIFPLF